MAFSTIIALTAIASVPGAPLQTARTQTTEYRNEQAKKAEGKPLPFFSLLRLDDSTVTNADIRGKVAVIHFYRISGPRCQVSLDRLQALHSEFASQGLVVVAATLSEPANRRTDPPKESLSAFLRAQSYAFTFAYNADELARDWKVPAMPTSFVVGRDGVVREVLIGVNDARMRELVPNLLAH
ncbi:MAG: TlpA disulfide reductase family protein [Fimbriimonadales bacterium]